MLETLVPVAGGCLCGVLLILSRFPVLATLGVLWEATRGKESS